MARTQGPDEQGPARALQENIDRIVRLEEHDNRRQSAISRFGERTGAFAGTLTFITIQLLLVLVWVLLNTGLAGARFVFDPPPFPFGVAAITFECVLLTSFVLIRQTQMSIRADRRSHLDLQINLLAEKEMTKALQMLRVITRRLGINLESGYPELAELTQDTEVEKLASDLRANLEDELVDNS